MKIAIFGLGYVGFTTMCCLAGEGHTVVGFDLNREKVEAVNNGLCPIVEPGVDDLFQIGRKDNRIAAFTEIGKYLDDCELAIICVGTPSGSDGSHNMTQIIQVTRQLARASNSLARKTKLTIAYRSTIRPGTIEEIVEPIMRDELGDNITDFVDLIMYPEFLRESTAVKDYFTPPKIVIGTRTGEENLVMKTLYRNIEAPVYNVRYKEAEFVKFVDNTWHALKVSFANEVGRVCLNLGIDVAKTHEIFTADTKLNISDKYLRPGGAFGGSCLPKDVRAMTAISEQIQAENHIIGSILKSNDAHKKMIFEMAIAGLKQGASILLVGLAFKAGTDDLRESPNVDLARRLLRAGYSLNIYDPAIDDSKLIGANLGYIYSQLPGLGKLLASKEDVDCAHYDRVLFGNSQEYNISLQPGLDIIHLGVFA